MFAVSEPLHEQHEHVPPAEVYEEPREIVSSAASEVFEPQRETPPSAEPAFPEIAHEEDSRATIQIPTIQIPVGNIEEQEIEEEEVELDAYEEELEEDAPYEELEERNARLESHSSPDRRNRLREWWPNFGQPALEGKNHPAAWRESAEELELEEAQEEAEALMEAEAIGAKQWVPAPKCWSCSGGEIAAGAPSSAGIDRHVGRGGAVSASRTRWCADPANC